MDFKVGDRVKMDRGSEFFKEEVLSAIDKNISRVYWWVELEKEDSLVIEKIEHMFDDVYDITLEGYDYSVSNHWIMHSEKE